MAATDAADLQETIDKVRSKADPAEWDANVARGEAYAVAEALEEALEEAPEEALEEALRDEPDGTGNRLD
jgi:hypothetical protein